MVNPMRPYLGRLAGVKDLATGIKLFQVELTEPEGRATVGEYRPGQFAFVSAFGAGEAPFGIASVRGPHLEFAVNALGHVTHTLHTLEVGDPVGARWTSSRAATSSSWARASAERRCAPSSRPSSTIGTTMVI